MKYLKYFESMGVNKKIHLLISEFILLMNSNGFISFEDLSIKSGPGNSLLIDIDGVCSLWVRESSILGYYPGNRNTFFIMGSNKDGSGDYSIQDANLYNRVISYLNRCINRLKSGKVGEKGKFKVIIPDLKEPEKVKLNISDKTRKMVYNMFKNDD